MDILWLFFSFLYFSWVEILDCRLVFGFWEKSKAFAIVLRFISLSGFPLFFCLFVCLSFCWELFCVRLKIYISCVSLLNHCTSKSKTWVILKYSCLISHRGEFIIKKKKKIRVVYQTLRKKTLITSELNSLQCFLWIWRQNT